MMEKYFKTLLAEGADLAIKIDAKTVITAPWTIYRCKYGCNTYGKSHCCPPKSPSWRETRCMIECYEYGILFRCHEMDLVRELAVGTARELFLDDYYKVIAFASGPCKRCKKCNEEYCLFPDKTVPAMEACGIDVFATVRNNHIQIHTLINKEEEQNHFGLIMVE